MQSKKITVLGGLGFAGSCVCRRLVSEGYRLTVFDRPGTSRFRLADIAGEMQFADGDYSKPDEVINAIADADCVINLVHTTVPASSMQNPVGDVTDNIAASVAWMSRLNQTAVKKVIYFSSGGTVYGTAADGGRISEDFGNEPICAYGISKLAIEKYLQMYCLHYNIRPLILRPANIYGPNPQLGRPQGLVGVLIAKALAGEPIEIIGDGHAVRDYIHVNDVAAAVSGLLSYQGRHTLFNVGSGEGHSINDMIALLKDYLTLPPLRYLPSRGFDVKSNILDHSLLSREIDWRPRVALRDGVKEVVISLKQTLQK